MQASVSVEGAETASNEQAALVWRVAQEAVRNALRHSEASTLAVTVRRRRRTADARGRRRRRRVRPGRGPRPGQLRAARPPQPGRRQRRHARGAILSRRRDDGADGGGCPVTATPIRVVLVDDHAVIRAGLEQLLAGTDDIEVVGTAANGAEALDGRPRDPARRRTDGPADARGRRRRRHPGDHGRGHRRGRAGADVVLRQRADHRRARRRRRRLPAQGRRPRGRPPGHPCGQPRRVPDPPEGRPGAARRPRRAPARCSSPAARPRCSPWSAPGWPTSRSPAASTSASAPSRRT